MAPNYHRKHHWNNGIRTTVPTISCILEWNSPDCQILDRKPPKFAPNFAGSRSLAHGLITPVFIHRLTTTAQPSKTTHRLSFTTTPTSNTYTTLPRTTSTAISTITEARRRTTNIPLQEIYAVRPTTPMGVLMATTSKTPSTSTDFPRTALISIASLSVIIIIAIVVFCVFRCRQSAPSADHYEMTCNGKQSGYTPISSETSPEMARNEMMHLSTSRPFMQGMFGNQLNGYQPIKGSVVPNSRNCVAGRNNNDISNGRRKEFKEWYV